ncbi:MAG: DUF2723 domain-containing protein [Alloprevotella sp.]|nr:DUF2723 domain-containing protein [Alloprevotella sp.]
MKSYKLVNNLVGWAVFLVAAFTYISTVEPSASFWDCPEFISTASKLDVGHPPGAPFFMLTGNLFSQFVSDPAQVAMMVNIMSAILSAFCILFLFWSITHLARMLVGQDGQVQNVAQLITVMGAGIAGALAYTWSDTFWFSAVEGEVYAYSSMFTALVFWLILKWEDHADEPHSDRWLILIFYLTGVAVGIHLLNLLCLPAIALVYCYKRYPNVHLAGSIVALGIGFLLVAAVLYGVVPGIVKVGGWFELLFVNGLGLPFNTGLIIYILVLVGVVLLAIWSSTQKNRVRTNVLYVASVALLGIPFYGEGLWSIVIGLVVLVGLIFLLQYKRGGNYFVRKRLLNTSLLCMLVLMIGYSSYAIIVIRSAANPPMDQNSPEDIFTLGTYLGREQYGNRPLFLGQAYSSEMAYDNTYHYKYISKDEMHRKEKLSADEKDEYETVTSPAKATYPSQLTMLFPRMYSSAHKQAYQDWLGDGLQTNAVEYQQGDGEWYIGEMPTQLSNLRFFLSYQVNFMYWRYFMWNFAGRQNGQQSFGEKEHGNFLTGISAIDNAAYGDQELLPDELKEDKGHNVFYCLPLLLGLLGLFWQAFKGEQGVRQFWVVFFLFFMTGLAIVLYLNQTPQQPRERDYAYAGSFYAFAIWIGLGVAAIAEWLTNALAKIKMELSQRQILAACLATALGILVPLQMVSQTWDDHDRSGRYLCRDTGMNYLATMPDTLLDGSPANPIIFTNGDNDTFPLWYAQETEGRYTQARVCNLEYLQTEWYTDQMVRPAYDSPALPIAWKRAEYVDDGKHGIFYIKPEKKSELDAFKKAHPDGPDPYDLRYIMDNYVRTQGFFPTDSVVVHVNKENVINQGITVPEGQEIPDHISISLKWAMDRGKLMGRNQVLVYEMLARNDWKRPIYMTVTLGFDNYAGLQDFFCLEGLAYRLTPFKRGMTAVDSEKMYQNMMNRFKYGNINQKGIFLDETNLRMGLTHRRIFCMLIQQLLAEGKNDQALAALRKCKEMLPSSNVFYSFDETELMDYWLLAGDKKEALRVAKELFRQNRQYVEWLNSLLADGAYNYQERLMRHGYYMAKAIDVASQCDEKEADILENEFEALSQTPAGRAAQDGLYYYVQTTTEYPENPADN